MGINSDEVQSVLKPKLEAPKKFGGKKNPLKNKMVMARLNPGILQKRLARTKAGEKGTPESDLVQQRKKARMTSAKTHNKEHKTGDATFYKTLMKAFEAKAAPFNLLSFLIVPVRRRFRFLLFPQLSILSAQDK